MKLYEVEQAIEECIIYDVSQVINSSTGEILDIEYLDNLQMEANEKYEQLIRFYKNLLADHKAYKEESQRLQKLAKTAENKAESIKKYLAFCLNGKKFKSEDGLHQISYRKSESVEIINIKELPEEFLKYAEPEANKTAIKEAIKNGETVCGAVLVEKQNVNIK